MEVAGPTDSDLKVLADLEKAEKKRQLMSEENNNRRINMKPLPV
jgi:hypothetical protein